MAKPHRSKPVIRRICKQPQLLTSLLDKLCPINPNIPKEFTMSTIRRNAIIRTVATITGDIAIGAVCASIAVWVIESATLGLFLSFLVWLLAGIAALSLSQYVIHPTVTVVMSDRKLDLAVEAVSGLADRLSQFTRAALQSI
jgi:hypothetical protein